VSSSKEVVPPSIDQNLSLYNVEGLDPRLGPVSKPPPLPTETSLPPLSISLSLSSDTFHRSNPEVTLTLTVIVLLHSSALNPITLDIRGQRWDLAQTVLMESLYLSYFTFTDTSPGVPLTPETPCASCDSGLDLNKEDALTLYPGKPHTLSHGFHNPDLFDIGASPLERTVVGHEYSLKLTTQGVNWRWGTVEIFANANHNYLFIEELEALGLLKLESDDEV
jgi:hypothetical protein